MSRENTTAVVAEIIKQKIETKERLVVGIDGRSGSGKTTLANALHERFGGTVIHADDFYLPSALRTVEREKEPGGNIHYERFKAEVMDGLRSGRPFRYGVYDCGTQKIVREEPVENTGLIIVEGSYSLHPVLEAPYDLKFFLDISPDLQSKRILERNGAEAAERFKSIWIPMEETYFNELRIRKQEGVTVLNIR